MPGNQPSSRLRFARVIVVLTAVTMLCIAASAQATATSSLRAGTNAMTVESDAARRPAMAATPRLASPPAARRAPDVVMNTIDPVATRAPDGERIRLSGPIGCRGGEITIVVRIDQAETGASAQGRWRARCTGVVQHWTVRMQVRGSARFADGPARVRASALGGRHRWSKAVEVMTRGFPRIAFSEELL